MSDRREVSHGVNILVLEGGGARGLSSLIILDELMTRLQHKMGLQSQPVVRDHFDVVAGTGTGAVIACMVGRLGVSVQQAIKQYVKLADVFAERKLFGTTSFKTTKLQDTLKSIVREVTGDENTRMMDSTEDASQCRTMVFAMSAHNLNANLPCIFRSYQGVSNQMPDCPIWQVLSATMAHPEMFKPTEIGPNHLRLSFLDGGLGCNNPTAHVLTEVKAVLPRRDMSSLVCIGAGHPDTIQLSHHTALARLIPSNVLALTKGISLDAERVAQEMETRFRSAEDLYFRFSVDQGMQRIEVGEWEKLSQVAANAQAYMRSPGLSKRVDSAVASIEARKNAVANRRIDGEIQLAVPSQGTGYKACPAPTPVFTGRQDTVEQISACLSKGDTQRCVFVLYGLGGSGKTQLALKTAQQTKHYWTEVIFVDATTHDTAVATLAGFAKDRNIGESHQSALNWLSNQRQRWLMIIDNADDPKVDIRQYFPAGDIGSILVTTRIEQHALLAQGQDADHQVSSMRPDEAMCLLLKTAKIKDPELTTPERQAASQLLEDLGYLALAIVQAGAYIFSSKQSIAQYLRIFSQHRRLILEKYTALPVKVDGYQKSVYTTWHMSYEQLGTNAQRLLHLMAFMYRSSIVEDIFRRAATRIQNYKPRIPETAAEKEIREYVTACLEPYLDSTGAWDSSAFVDTMRELLSYSLISYDWTNTAYTLHVLVQDWASTEIKDPLDVAIGHTALLLAVSIDYDDAMTSLEYKLMIETHVNILLNRQETPSANNAALFGEVYYRSGNWKKKERMNRITVDGTKEVLGEEDPSTLSSMNNLALTYQNQGKYREAVALQEQLVDIRKRVSGHDHRSTLIAMSNLAGTHYSLGRYTDAQSLQLHILDTFKRVYGHEDPDTLISMHSLAVTYIAQGRYDEAQALLVQVVDAKKRVKGDEHPSTLASMDELASTYYHQGRYDGAESIQVHVLEVTKRRQGDEHPHTLATMNDLALTYSAQGRYGEAEELQVKVLEARKQAHGDDHPYTLTSMQNLANTYRVQGRYELAEELGKKAVDGRNHVLGTKHPHTLLSMRHLLATYNAMGERRKREYTALEGQIAELEKSAT
ncbi:kinesin light chain [Ceratobasidium sp. AG-Ba]|nr:kinesin light chain [Ceratobasidium sp. AG-Ba]